MVSFVVNLTYASVEVEYKHTYVISTLTDPWCHTLPGPPVLSPHPPQRPPPPHTLTQSSEHQ